MKMIERPHSDWSFPDPDTDTDTDVDMDMDMDRKSGTNKGKRQEAIHTPSLLLPLGIN